MPCNTVNNSIRLAKKNYFTRNFEANKTNPRKTWQLINDLTSRTAARSKIISQLKVGDQKITSPTGIAEVFNNHFSSIAETLSNKLPSCNIKPEFYLNPANSSFTIVPPSAQVVCDLLCNIDEKKAIGLDGIPNKLLKMSAYIVGPSLSKIFNRSIET